MLNLKTILTQNIQNIWDTIKRTNLRIIGIEEETFQLKDTQKIFSTKLQKKFFLI